MNGEHSVPPVARFSLLALAWSLASFAIIRLSWIDQRLIEWLVDVQRRIALWYGAPSRTTVVVDGSCSGADVTALCIAVCLAYPAPWRRRLAGALGGTAIILTLNTIRIGTLLAAYPDRQVFTALHLYVWPALLMLTVAAYTFVWMVGVERRHASPVGWLGEEPQRVVRFAIAAGALLMVYAASAPWTMVSEHLLKAATWTAAVGAGVLSMLGLPSSAQGNLLFTDRGVFQVTQECLLTPVLPIYLAAVLTGHLSRRTRWLAALSAVPIFLALGVLRVLVLALPPAIASSPLVVAHGFYQIVCGAVIIGVTCIWNTEHPPARVERRAAVRFAMSSAAALTLALVAGNAWSGAVAALANAGFTPHAAPTWQVPGDVQGALALLPAFQLGLLTGLSVAANLPRSVWRVAAAFAALAASQVLVLAGVGEASTHFGVAAHAVVLRAWSLALPVTLWWLFLKPRNTDSSPRAAYRWFWEEVGANFPDLRGARSTAFYFEGEVRLWSDHLRPLEGRRVLKSDLWDEAKNTRILQWAADEGACVYGIDVSEPIVRQAECAFGRRRLRAAVADLRSLPFRDSSFDVIYSMGTIEHFDDSEAAVAEMARVLEPGGRLVLGVPNRHDPFLRPLLVVMLRAMGLYGYGFEKSYSRRQLRAMIERAGLQVVAETGILFMPGWLRMLDLLGHTRGWKAVTALTAPAVALFVFLERRVARLRRHGYLIAAAAVKPPA